MATLTLCADPRAAGYRDGVSGAPLARLTDCPDAEATYGIGWRAGRYVASVNRGALGLTRTASQTLPSGPVGATPLRCVDRVARASGAAGGPPPLGCAADRPPSAYDDGVAAADVRAAQRATQRALTRAETQRDLLTARPSATGAEIRLLDREIDALERQQRLQRIFQPPRTP